MLVGNIAAFGGTMINADFRQHWWPLACTHVAMNLGLLGMELVVTPQRRNARLAAMGETGHIASRRSMRTGCFIIATGAALAMDSWGTWSTETMLGTGNLFGIGTLLDTGAGACVSAYAYALYCCYSTPASLPDKQREIQAEDSI